MSDEQTTKPNGKSNGHANGKPRRKKHDILANLEPRKREYVLGRVNGKSKIQSARDAGYSENMARTAKRIETAEVQLAFAELMRQAIPAEKIIARLQEGMDAQKTEFAKLEGRITDQRDCVDFEQRRKYLELAAQYGEFYVAKMDHQVSGQVVLKHTIVRPEVQQLTP